MHGERPDDKAKQARLKECNSVRSSLYEAGLTLLDIDRKYDLKRGTCGTTLREPNAAGERAIAKALNTKSFLLWPSRYYANGRRKSPQPRENYQRLTFKDRGALARSQSEVA